MKRLQQRETEVHQQMPRELGRSWKLADKDRHQAKSSELQEDSPAMGTSPKNPQTLHQKQSALNICQAQRVPTRRTQSRKVFPDPLCNFCFFFSSFTTTPLMLEESEAMVYQLWEQGQKHRQANSLPFSIKPELQRGDALTLKSLIITLTGCIQY